MNFVLGITACGGGDATDKRVPTVIATQPAEGTTGVLNNSVLSITFNVDMDPSTLTDTNFTVAGSKPVSGTLEYDAVTRTATFIPVVPLEPGIDHTITLTTGITDVDGYALASVFVLRFTTETFIQRLSVDSVGLEANSNSINPAISDDGRYVVFLSHATNLVSGDTNASTDIFKHDTQTGTTIRVSVDSNGSEADGNSDFFSSVSADGRYVVFSSIASNLVTEDTNSTYDVFMRDTQIDATMRISVDSAGNQANDYSKSPAISADGRYVVFQSFASNLVTDDTNGVQDIFRYDIQTSTTTRISVDSTGNQANNSSGSPAISADGRYVVYESVASNLVIGDTNNYTDVFINDMETGITKRVSVDSIGQQANQISDTPAISYDGRYVVFNSGSSNLVSDDTNGYNDIFLHDTQTSITKRVSVDSTGQEANYNSYRPAISADGHYVVFESLATNLFTDDTNAAADIFRHNTQDGTTTRIDYNLAEITIFKFGYYPAISADGRYVVFQTSATNLAPEGDTNLSSDIFRVLLNTVP